MIEFNNSISSSSFLECRLQHQQTLTMGLGYRKQNYKNCNSKPHTKPMRYVNKSKIGMIQSYSNLIKDSVMCQLLINVIYFPVTGEYTSYVGVMRRGKIIVLHVVVIIHLMIQQYV